MSFDQIVATFPSEFITKPQTLSELYRVLEPGGELLLLPVAWITGSGRAQRLAALLFKITGQAPDQRDRTAVEAFLEPLNKAGFLVEDEMIAVRDSKVLLIHAHK